MFRGAITSLSLGMVFLLIEPQCQIRKGVCQGCTLSPCLFNLCTEYIMGNAGLDEAQAGIKIARRNNNLRYANDTTLIAEREEELNNFLMRVKELKTQHSKSKDHGK